MYEYRVKDVVKVIDGDTVRFEIDVGFNIHHQVVIRLAGIDAPEMRGEERYFGELSRDYLRSLLLNRDSITIKTERDKKGKYGRYIGWIYVDDIKTSVNEMMIEGGFADEYV